MFTMFDAIFPRKKASLLEQHQVDIEPRPKFAQHRAGWKLTGPNDSTNLSERTFDLYRAHRKLSDRLCPLETRVSNKTRRGVPPAPDGKQRRQRNTHPSVPPAFPGFNLFYSPLSIPDAPVLRRCLRASIHRLVQLCDSASTRDHSSFRYTLRIPL